MKTKEFSNVPLFLHLEDSITTIIINNDLVYCDFFANRQRWPFKAFTILKSLYDSQITNEQLSGNFSDFFIGIGSSISEKPYHCLIGEDFTPEGFESFLCLELDVEIKKHENFPVNLKNFKLQGKSMNYSISLSSEQAFLIFSNICSNSRCIVYEDLLSKNGLIKFDRHYIEKNIQEHYQYLPQLSVIDTFVLHYIDDLQERIMINTISPYKILQASGARLLVFLADLQPVKDFIHHTIDQLKNYEKLKLSELVMYVTLLECLVTFKIDSFQFVKDFIENNSSLVSTIKKKVRKDF